MIPAERRYYMSRTYDRNGIAIENAGETEKLPETVRNSLIRTGEFTQQEPDGPVTIYAAAGSWNGALYLINDYEHDLFNASRNGG